MIVVRSVVSGGAAAADGHLAPGDRLVSVNGLDVSTSPLAVAVAAIKSAPKGNYCIRIALKTEFREWKKKKIVKYSVKFK